MPSHYLRRVQDSIGPCGKQRFKPGEVPTMEPLDSITERDMIVIGCHNSLCNQLPAASALSS
jgi:hypothetical protein